MRHDEGANDVGEVPDEVLAELGWFPKAAARLQALHDFAVGKVVSSSLAGTSGFLLLFTDATWVISYLEGDRLTWLAGAGEPSAEQLRLMQSPEAGDGSKPLAYNFPYADEDCDMAAELCHAHGQQVSDIAIGEKSFNFAFPDDHELETFIVVTPEDRFALRVYWEQW